MTSPLTPLLSDAPEWEGRPLPAMTKDTEFWWIGAAGAELRIQLCRTCRQLQHPPEPACLNCHSFDLTWTVSNGRGRIYSFVVYHEPRLPGFSYPYVAAVVELDEGTRLITQLVDVVPDEVHIGQRVQVRFRRIAGGPTLPVFMPEAG